MPKITLDMNAFKALASDTRLDILRVLDGKRMSLKDICNATNLNKATLHEHLVKLNQAGLVKRNEREGHKWVYYRLTWKGEGLLHPENSKIVVMFTATFIALSASILQFVNFVKGQVVARAVNFVNYQPSTDSLSRSLIENEGIKNLAGNSASTSDMKWKILTDGIDSTPSECYSTDGGVLTSNGHEIYTSQNILTYYDPLIQQIAIVLIAVFALLLFISFWRYWKNRTTSL